MCYECYAPISYMLIFDTISDLSSLSYCQSLLLLSTASNLNFKLTVPRREHLFESQRKIMEDEQAHKDAEIKIEIERNRGKVQGRRDLIGEKNALKKLKEVDQEFILFLNAYTR